MILDFHGSLEALNSFIMIKRTLYFGNPAYLSTKLDQLVVRLPEVEKNDSLPEAFKKEAAATIPIEDIGVVQPTETKQDKKNYTDFRKKMQKDGFTMFQFSAYLRHCSSRENAEVHVKRVQRNLPPKGHVGILTVTDKQFGMMQVFFGGVEKEKAPVPQQLELF
jgi:CRISPR-associated protein Cas2